MRFVLLIFSISLFHFHVLAQNQYPESQSPGNMATGVYYQAGPGSNNSLGWTYRYGTKLSVINSSTRNFELVTTGYPNGDLKLRQWDATNNVWSNWRSLLTQNSEGDFVFEEQVFIQDKGETRENSYLRISRGSEGKDRALVSYGDDGNYQWHTGLLYGGGWQTPDFYISTKDRFRNSGVIEHEPEFTITTTGNVGVGIRIPVAKLAVNGDIHAREVKVDLTGWPDYVFNTGYNLPTLKEVEIHIQEKGHLINIPPAKEVEENGIQLGEMNKLLLEKIEELTLYTLQQEKRIENLEKMLKLIQE